MIVPVDLRLRLVSACLVVVAISQLRDLAVAALVLVVASATACVVGLGRGGWRRLLHVEGFVLLLFASLPFTVPGREAFTIGPLSASVEGLWRASLLACKVLASVIVLVVALGSIEPARIGGTLRGLHLPEPIVRLFVLTARYLEAIRDEARRLAEAMRARGFRARSNRHTWRSYGNLIGMLLVRTLDRAERVEEAMLCRGYGGRLHYTSPTRPSARDWMAFAAAVAAAAALFAMDRL